VIKGGSHLQVVTYDERQAFTQNHPWGTEAAAAVDALLAEPLGHWHVATTEGELGYRVTKSGRVLVTRSATARAQDVAHDRSKARLVDASEPFLHELGIADGSGRIKPSRTDKYRQVEEFVRLLDASVREARDAGRLSAARLRIVDLGCGNAYLTFAAYRHLTAGLGLSVEMVGVDVKEQARRRNTEVAQRLGWSDVRFVEGTIADAEVAAPVHVALALHACDTATDEALARAIGWRSQLVLAAPCCHHDLQRQLRRAPAPEPYDLVTRHGLLRERWGDLLTDALRVHLLRRSGYRTDVVEFVDSLHTPRNVLLRAHRTGVPPTAEQDEEYRRLVSDWGVRPYLEELLDRSTPSREVTESAE
jgi:SAM-dependent methyltransferase